MTLVDIGAGTGTFAAAFSDWFDISVLAVEPSAAMRDHILRTPAIQVLAGNGSALTVRPQREPPADRGFAVS
jgi:precorrin-6B methylase 2